MILYKRSEVQIPIIFLISSSLWIIFSDRLFQLQPHSYLSAQLTHIQTIKGIFFVVVVSLLIYFIVKSANKKLLQTQEEYKDLFFYTPDSMLVYDIATKKIKNINKAALETYGYSEEEFLNLTIYDLRSGTVQIPENIESHIYTHKKKDGSIFFCHETAREIKVENTSVCLVSAHDITELEKAKEQLEQRESQLKLILDSVTDGFFILNRDLEIVRANEVFKKMVEVRVDEVEGRKLLDVFPSLQGQFSYKKCAQVIEKHNSIYFESFYKKTSSWFRVSAYPYDGGLSVFFRDITNEKEAELQIYQNGQNLLALINNTEDLIWSIDQNFRYFTYNEPYEKWYGKLFGETISVDKIALNEGQGEEHIKRWKSLYERALNGEKFSVDMNFIVDDLPHFTTISFNPIYNAEKKVTGVGCFLHNITERKLYEKKIEQHNQKLKDIAAITSHQVRVPLANILGLVEILDEEDPVSSSNRTIIEHIKTSAIQLDELIRNMVQQTIHAKIE